MIRFVFLLLTGVFLSACNPADRSSEPTSTPQKRIALTYDDAPKGKGPVFTGAERTDAIVEALDTSRTGPVAFFVTTRGFDTSTGRERIVSYAKAGHVIANHSHNHMWASRVGIDKYMADIDRAEVNLAALPNRRPWFRFPYLDEGGRAGSKEAIAKRDRLREALDERGLMNGYVTVDTFDWYLDDLWRKALKADKLVNMEALSRVYVDMVVEAAEHYDGLAVTALGRRPVQVLLLHENDLAASFTENMVNALRDRGWTIVAPDEAYADPMAAMQPVTTLTGSGKVAALAMDAGIKPDKIFNHWSISRKAIDERVRIEQMFTPSGN